MVRLSVNINKIATIRNARGGNMPDVVKCAMDCERFGAEGITVHPRPDQRHIRRSDVLDLKPVLTTEFNIEGNPQPEFIELVKLVHPAQVTLVPDSPNVLTSNAGWDTIKFKEFLKKRCRDFKEAGIRVSLFIDPDIELIKNAADCGCDRVELYTEAYARDYTKNREAAIEPYFKAAKQVAKSGLGLNAGDDLSPVNLKYFKDTIPGVNEVSIGHALICDALYMGLEGTIKAYLKELSEI